MQSEIDHSDIVNHNRLLALKLGITAAPSFIIGEIDSHNPSKIKGITYFSSALPFAEFEKQINQTIEELHIMKASN